MTECLQWAGPLPLQIRACLVACKDDCTLTAWSKFSECAGCGSSRIRKRSLAGKDLLLTHCETHAISRQPFYLFCWNNSLEFSCQTFSHCQIFLLIWLVIDLEINESRNDKCFCIVSACGSFLKPYRPDEYQCKVPACIPMMKKFFSQNLDLLT